MSWRAPVSPRRRVEPAFRHRTRKNARNSAPSDDFGPLKGGLEGKIVICQERPFHDNFVTLAKYSCHFLELLTNGVIVVARADKGSIGKLTFAYTLLFVWLASYEESPLQIYWLRCLLPSCAHCVRIGV